MQGDQIRDQTLEAMKPRRIAINAGTDDKTIEYKLAA